MCSLELTVIRKIVGAVSLLSICACFGFAAPVRISPEDAEARIVKQGAPLYPPLAEAAHIQGNILLHIKIDETGVPSVLSVVSGHPMLALAAADAIPRWRYRPIEVNGKPVAAVTFVRVRFGNPKNQDAEAIAELKFLHSYYTALDAATSVIEAGTNDERLQSAEQLLESVRMDLSAKQSPATSSYRLRQIEKCLFLLGNLKVLENKPEGAEQYYKQALVIQEGVFQGVTCYRQHVIKSRLSLLESAEI
jgi:TonB family protein